uniref:ABC-type phosphate/phosphonate transport system periplasmic component-like protein n=1 Tax=Cyanothece sp. (strain PCC 7425 / ATCC 29141) TaxID=395961 RepID=B8HKW9_CYAP4
MTIERLALVSYLAPNSFWYYQEIAAYLERKLGMPTSIRQGNDPLTDRRLAQQQVDLTFICGLPLVRFNQQHAFKLKPIVAPVLQADRYSNQPVYFADVIVRSDSGMTEFEQLCGKVFCFNDLGSNSGYHLVKRHLAEQHYSPSFIAKEIPSGSHQTSIQWVIEGKADWAAIDSTMLEQELRDRADLQQWIRVIQSIGPCPIPPIALSPNVPPELAQHIQDSLLNPDPQLQLAMTRAGIRRYAPIALADYHVLTLESQGRL